MAKRKTLPRDFWSIVQTGNEEEIKKVFEKCDINAYGGAHKGNALSFKLSYDMMKWLIEQGADINYVDAHGGTPFMEHAGYAHSAEQALYLMNWGADVHGTLPLYKENALHLAVPAGNIELIQALLEKGVDAYAINWDKDTPLEKAFHRARTFELIKLEPVTKYLLSQGIPITGRLKEYFLKVAQDIEFRRDDLNQDHVPELDAALNSLYTMMNVEPVPRRVQFDGTSPIVVASTTWQKQHNELWDLLVPGSGHAKTVQGEVIRISGKIGYEILDNGGMNWDADYKKLCQVFLEYIQSGVALSADEVRELKSIITSIKRADEKECDRITELGVKWVLLNPNPVVLGSVDYRR